MQAPDQVIYPKVQIDGKEIEVRFRCGDIVRLKKDHKIDIEKLTSESLAANIEQTLTVLCAGIAHATKKTAGELMDVIDFTNFKDIAQAIGESLKKAIPQKPPEELPPSTIN